MKIRCPWVGEDRLMIEYHDKEWGVPVHDERQLFEFLILESAQAGLSWITVLRKRANYRLAFDNYDENKINELMGNKGIIRNRRKILATVANAKAVLKIQKDFGSFEYYIWQFVEGKPIQNKWKKLEEIPSFTLESENMSKDLKKRGFKFVGPTTCYSFMQAVGMVNDHITDCYRYHEPDV